MKAYSEYKDSGVGWLGDIPSSWGKNKFKFLLREKPKTQNIDLPCGSISFGSVVYKASEKLTEETRLAYQEVLSGEFLVNPLNLNYDLKSLRTALSSLDVIVSSGYIVLQSNGTAVPEYLKWLLFVFDVRHMKTLGAGIRQTITFKDIGNCVSYLPSVDEQKVIAAYLDRETARIDNLIAEKQNFINLLKEKRRTLISHVVTKGLDPNVKMKDSGIEWIGDMPEHWLTVSYRYVCKIYRGKFTHRPRNDPAMYDGPYPFIQTGDVANAKEFITTYKQTLSHEGIKVSQLIPKGTLMMVITGAKIGSTAVLDFDAYAPDSVVGFKAMTNVELAYLNYSLQAAMPALEQTSIQSTQPNLNIDRIGSLKTPLPPLEEQVKIVHYLENHLSFYIKIVNEVENSIVLLQEHRSTLISAAVTGKIDVREQR